MRIMLLCLLMLGVASGASPAPEYEDGFALMILRLDGATGVFGSGRVGPQKLVELVVGENRRPQLPHVIGLLNVRDASEVEELIWPLNRALRPDEATYVTWLTGGGPDGQKMAILSLFPLVGYQDLFEAGRTHKILYAMLDAPEEILHVILVGHTGVKCEGSGDKVSSEKTAARVVGIILRQDPAARIVLMGDLKLELFSQGFPPEREPLGCIFCPEVGQNSSGVIMVHPHRLGQEEPAVEMVGKTSAGNAVKVKWTPPGKRYSPESFSCSD